MVKRSILEKMSTAELGKYIGPDSPYVYQAIEIAYDILKSRGIDFSDSDKNRIEELIRIKKEEELNVVQTNNWDVNATDENSDIELFSQKSIWYFSILLGVHTGAILLAINLFIISKNIKGLFVITFGIVYSILMYITYIFAKMYAPDYYILILIFMTAGGAAILQFYFWDKYLKGIIYKKKEITVPLAISIIFYAIIIIITMF